MAFASIISSAIGIILLIITAYVLVAGVLTTTQIAMNAQSDMTAVHMEMLGTSVNVDSISVINSSPSTIYLNVRNTGSEPIDLSHTSVFIWKNGAVHTLVNATWTPAVNQWRPTETLNMSVSYSDTYPVIIQITTGNGVSAITEVSL
jgi:archaeal flagellar protein FlaF